MAMNHDFDPKDPKGLNPPKIAERFAQLAQFGAKPPVNPFSLHGKPLRGEEHAPSGRIVQDQGRFGRMFPMAKQLQVGDAALTELAEAMLEPDAPDAPDPRPPMPIDLVQEKGDNPGIPAGYTYLGQFIDHDITLDVTSLAEANEDVEAVFNFRTPRLDLDSLYGGGLDASPHLYSRDRETFLFSDTVTGGGDPTVPSKPNDLPRAKKTGLALIGDPRNDENLVVAQTHVTFMKFHNAVVNMVKAEPTLIPRSPEEIFERARHIVIWHYQWIVLHDFLPRIADPAIVKKVIEQGLEHFQFGQNGPFMPIEFAGAAFRLGHSMVRSNYKYNRVFKGSSLDFLFIFSGLGGGRTEPIPSDWIIDWRNFLEVPDGPGKLSQPQKSRRINQRIARAVGSIRPLGKKSLAERNLLRGDRLKLPSGQEIAAKIKAKPLSADEIASSFDGGTNDGKEGAIVVKHKLDQETPLWYYILKEAGVRCQGKHLGEVGSTIVAETFLGLLQGDPMSFLNREPNWKPFLPTIPGRPDLQERPYTFADLVNFVNEINPVGP